MNSLPKDNEIALGYEQKAIEGKNLNKSDNRNVEQDFRNIHSSLMKL